MQWYERARDIAAQKGISHDKIAERIGKGRSTVSGWLAGEREPKLAQITMLAKVLGTTPQALLFGTDGNEPAEGEPYDGVTAVKVWDGEKLSNKTVPAPDDIGVNSFAFILPFDSGCDVAPKGTSVIVDPDIDPVNGDYVLAKVKETASVFRMVFLAGDHFLSVDDQRAPFVPLPSAELMGVIVFISRKVKS